VVVLFHLKHILLVQLVHLTNGNIMIKDIDLLFATPIAKIYTENFQLCDTLKQYILKDIDRCEFKNKTWTSDDTLNDNPIFFELKKMIDMHAQLFFEEVIGIKFSDVEMCNMWYNVQQAGCRHHIHQHPNSYFSGVFYINTPDNPGSILFIDPRPAKNMQHADYVKTSPLSDRVWRYEPKTSLLMFFPSWLEHGTDPGSFDDNKEKRISLSFNYKLKRASGNTMRFS
jgi:uncharacterized protein (TIGR02466 family)